MSWKIGVDGGGTKTECVLVDPSGAVAARHTGPGCSPSLVGMDRAMEIAAEVIRAVRAGHESAPVSFTLLCMAGSRAFWKKFGEGLRGCGRIDTVDDGHFQALIVQRAHDLGANRSGPHDHGGLKCLDWTSTEH